MPRTGLKGLILRNQYILPAFETSSSDKLDLLGLGLRKVYRTDADRPFDELLVALSAANGEITGPADENVGIEIGAAVRGGVDCGVDCGIDQRL